MSKISTVKKALKLKEKQGRYVYFSKPNIFRSLLTSFRAFFEIFTGFLFVSNYSKAISFFGSARESVPESYYADTEELAARMSKRGFTIITGGSGGIMRAANRGAWKVNGNSVGVNIRIPNEANRNPFLTASKQFQYFFLRKTILSCASEIYIFFPGGFGTLDELFEMLTMLQTGHSEKVPVILYGKEFWGPLMEYIEKVLRDQFKTISQSDVNLIMLLDSVDEVEGYIDSIESTLVDRVCYVGAQ